MRRLKHILQRVVLTSVILALVFLIQATVMAQTTVYINPIRDAHISEKPTAQNLNFGGYDYLVVGKDADNGRCDILMGFQALQTIPSGANIADATLSFYVCGSGGTSSRISIRRVDRHWAEYSVTWLSMLGGFGTEYAFVFPPNSGWVSVDVTALIQDWVNGTYPERGLALVPSGPNNDWYYAIPSRHISSCPMLRVTYQP